MPNLTKMENMINPEVMGDMLDAKIEAQLKLTPYAKVDTSLEGVPGDTKTVPSWNYIGDAEDVPEGEEIDTTKMTSASETFTVKKAMKAVEITQESINSGLGNPVGTAETQLMKSIAGKVDNDVIDAVYNGTMTSGDGSKVIGYDGLVDAVTKFEDEEDGIDKVMFINPLQEATLLKDSNFLSADKFEPGVMVRGAIGRVAGCQIKKSKKVRLVTHVKDNDATSGTTTITTTNIKEYQGKVDPSTKLVARDKVKALTAANQYFVNPIIKMEPDSAETEYTEDELPAITIFLKKGTSLDHTFYARKQTHELVAARYYGVALTNGAKVVLAKFKK